MGFNIGNVLSPTVLGALARRGEMASQMPTIQRDYGSRTVQNPELMGGADQLAERRFNASREDAMADRAARDRAFEFEKDRLTSQDKRQEASDKMAGRKAEMDQQKLDLANAAEIRRIHSEIERVTRNAMRPDPITKRPNPEAMANAEEIVANFRAQLEQLGYQPPAEIRGRPAPRAGAQPNPFDPEALRSAGPLDQRALDEVDGASMMRR